MITATNNEQSKGSGFGLEINYKPIVLPMFNKTVAYDASVVLFDEELGSVVYKDFRTVAERTDVNPQVEQWIFGKVCRKVREMLQKDEKFEYISVNVSARYMKKESYVSDLLEILSITGAPPEKICLEVSEKDLEADSDIITDKLYELKREGFLIAVDDYSGSYMPMSRLDSVPANFIKLDKSVTSRILLDRKAEKTVRAIVQCARNMECAVIAKGVEDQKHKYLLISLGCEMIQGQPAEEIAEEKAV